METTTSPSANGLSPNEERIRLAVTEKVSDLLSRQVGGSLDSMQDALDRHMEMMDLRCERILEQHNAKYDTVKVQVNDINDVVKKAEETALKAEAVVRECQEKIKDVASRVPKQPAPPLLPGLDKLMKPEQQTKFFAAQANLFQHIARDTKTTAQAQKVLYKAGDEAARLLNTKGSLQTYYHVTAAEAGLTLGATLLLGAGMGIGGTLFMQARARSKAGYTANDQKAWLAAGRERVAAATPTVAPTPSKK